MHFLNPPVLAQVFAGMDLTAWQAVQVVVAGALAGAINTLAGSGSLVTLPLLLSLGLPANVANGTNRVGVFFQGLTALGTIRARGTHNWKSGWWVVAWYTAGALIGARVAVDVPERMLKAAILVLMAFMLVVLLVRPQRWLANTEPKPDAARKPLNWLLFLAVGFYGGFIQAGVGIFLISALVLRAGFDLVSANTIKLLVVFAFSLPVLAVFVRGGQVVWSYGLLLALGQALGAWGAARFATDVPNAAQYMRWLLIGVVLLSVVLLGRDVLQAHG